MRSYGPVCEFLAIKRPDLKLSKVENEQEEGEQLEIFMVRVIRN